ncbi:MAG: hypothetical protein ABI218_13195 [Caldimonas sp.]
MFLSTLCDSSRPPALPRPSYRHLHRHRDVSAEAHFGHELARLADADSARDFVISAPREAADRLHAAELLGRRYAWRGYRLSPLEGFASRGRLTLVASACESVVGTLTAAVEADSGLSVERIYPREVAALRGSGTRLCEFTRFAVDEDVRSSALLGALFHVACMHVMEVHHCTRALIEVNPRHVRFYEQMLDFRRAGETRMDPAVAAPAVLMQLDLAHCARQIDALSGRPASSGRLRSYYPHFFAKAEAELVLGRLRMH